MLLLALLAGVCFGGASSDAAGHQIQTPSNDIEKLKYRYNLHAAKKQGAVKGAHGKSPAIIRFHSLTAL